MAFAWGRGSVRPCSIGSSMDYKLRVWNVSLTVAWPRICSPFCQLRREDPFPWLSFSLMVAKCSAGFTDRYSSHCTYESHVTSKLMSSCYSTKKLIQNSKNHTDLFSIIYLTLWQTLPQLSVIQTFLHPCNYLFIAFWHWLFLLLCLNAVLLQWSNS